MTSNKDDILINIVLYHSGYGRQGPVHSGCVYMEYISSFTNLYQHIYYMGICRGPTWGDGSFQNLDAQEPNILERKYRKK